VRYGTFGAAAGKIDFWDVKTHRTYHGKEILNKPAVSDFQLPPPCK
jgi:hypothetical protein